MKVLAVEWSEARVAEAEVEFPDVHFVRATDAEMIVSEIADAEVVFGHIDREAFLAAKQLRWIQYGGAGVEKVLEMEELVESDVILTNASGAHVDTMSEHAFGMLVYLARSFGQLTEAQADHVYVPKNAYHPVGLAGMTLGIIGLGNIGRALARRGRAFEMDVIAVDEQDVECPDYLSGCRLLDGLPDLLRRCDAVMVSTPQTARSIGMLGAEEIGYMKPGAYLLVVSRGRIVDEDALVTALQDGRLRGAGLDVQAIEPLPEDSPLWDAPNLILTPHCSDISARTTENSISIMKDNLRRYLAGEPLRNIVDKKLGY